jgi:lantibiotic biosynthesis protein
MQITFLDKIVFRTPVNSYNKKDVVDINAMEEALYLASPVLLAEAKKDHEGKRSKKLHDSVFKYHIRSCTRCTPFGLFAGVGVSAWGNSSEILLHGRHRKTRLDMNYVCALGQYIASLNEVKKQLLFYPNNTIYEACGKLRYVEYRFMQTNRLYFLSEVSNSEYLQKILRLAQDGAYLEDLATAITDADITLEEATEFLADLVSSQLLKSELEPNVTGNYYFDKILQTLQRIECRIEFFDVLCAMNKSIKQLDENICNPVSNYKEIISRARKLPVPFEENQLFQADLYWNTSTATLNKTIQDELMRAVKFLGRFQLPQSETPLNKFAKELYERYEHAEVPLLQALDTEAGIGYAHNKGKDNNRLIDGIITGQRPDPTNFEYNATSIMLHRKLKEAYRNKQYVVQFTDDDVQQLPAAANHLPATFSVSFSLPQGEDFIVFGNANGPCAANTLGRFCYPGNQVLQVAEAIIQHENKFYEGKIVAEIVHLPEARTGNILLRPCFREYEIPYLSNASTPPERTMPLSDLYVSAGAGDRIILRSKRLNKEVIPRLTNAHNFSFNALPVYQFLCDLQGQGIRPYISFHWGSFEQEYQFTPRAMYGNLILKPAKWKLNKEDVQPLLDAGFNKSAITQFLEKWQMPGSVLLADHDNTLLVEWFNECSFRAFADTVRQKDKLILIEHLFKASVVKDEAGNCYANEFIAFALNTDLPLKEPSQPVIKECRRSFPPGSEWLYYKLYTGKKTADTILSQHVKPLAHHLLKCGLSDRWFFVRYLDPNHHLRVRFHLSHGADAAQVMNEANHYFNQLSEQSLIWKIQLDTYQRETERYGLFGMEDCERFFWHNSELVLSILTTLHGEEGEKARWRAGFKAIDELLNDFGFDIQQKEKLASQSAQSFLKEFGDSKLLKLSLNNKYRSLRNEIQLDGAPLFSRSPLAEKFISIKESRNLHLQFNGLVCSFIHMMINRLFKSQQRLHELVLYNFLSQHYRGVLARERSRTLSGVEGARTKIPSGVEES